VKLTFLGTGTSFGIPQVGCRCPVCTSDDPRDRRTRSGAVVETPETRILVDTPPELRLQLVAAGISSIDAVLYTHEHADHTNGIDDLRIFSARQRRALPIYGPPETLDRLQTTFSYIFDDRMAFEGTTKPQLELHPLEADRVVSVSGQEVLPLAFPHGHLRVFGYRFGSDLAYLTDVKRVGPAELERLRGVRVLVLNALWWRPHPTHMSIAEAIALAQDIGAGATYLTHLTHETGHAELAASLPGGVFPAYDGLVVETSST
jgi:phosphoribosyl 1,2-cyclic phosphate phosphodiesterase